MASGRSWRLDRSNARVTFRVRWFGVLRVSGWFRDVEGDLTLPDASGGAIVVDLRVAGGSVRTGIGLRDRHLRGPRFLDAASHPVIRFSSARVGRANGRWQVAGTLQLRGTVRALSVVVRDEPHGGDDRRLVAAFHVPRREHHIGAARGVRRLNPLLWAIANEVAVEVALTVPNALLQPLDELTVADPLHRTPIAEP